MPRIVIIGGGPAGINCAQALANQLQPKDNVEVTVIEKSKYYYHAIGTPRAYVEAEFTPKLFIPYDNAIPKKAKSFIQIIRAVATSISADSVSYRVIGDNDEPSDETKTISFDYLVIATGSITTVPLNQDGSNYSRTFTEAKFNELREQIAKADKILIVGGGSVGCEVAGEIKAKYPKKEVTILEARDTLVATPQMQPKFYSYLYNSLQELDIKYIVGERFPVRLTDNSFEKRKITTDKGTVIESDIQLLCGGFSPATELVSEFDNSLVAPRGFIKVNAQLQLDDPRYPHMFVLGDASNHDTPKMAYWAGEQGKFLAKELVAVIQKKQSGFTKPFPKVEVNATILPLGPNGGVSQLPLFGGIVFGNFLTRLIKAKDMFAARSWASLGATVPN